MAAARRVRLPMRATARCSAPAGGGGSQKRGRAAGCSCGGRGQGGCSGVGRRHASGGSQAEGFGYNNNPVPLRYCFGGAWLAPGRFQFHSACTVGLELRLGFTFTTVMLQLRPSVGRGPRATRASHYSLPPSFFPSLFVWCELRLTMRPNFDQQRK